jgi:activator of 2-hydroxyglutaryl-CoA dehydratase
MPNNKYPNGVIIGLDVGSTTVKGCKVFAA